jgi:hypothetical protein
MPLNNEQMPFNDEINVAKYRPKQFIQSYLPILPIYTNIPVRPYSSSEVRVKLSHLASMQNQNYEVIHPFLESIYKAIFFENGIEQLISLMVNPDPYAVYMPSVVLHNKEYSQQMKLISLSMEHNDSHLHRYLDLLKTVLRELPALQPILDNWIDTILDLVFMDRGVSCLQNFIFRNELPELEFDQPHY